MEESPEEIRERLRELPVLDGDFGRFDPDSAPQHPAELFLDWLSDAIEREVREPHAMTVSTVDAESRPDSRVLILKGLDDGRWEFAASRSSKKGEQLAACPWVALNFHWPEIGRQIRIRGRVIEASAEASTRDFLDRSEGSRAQALTENQSRVLHDPAELDAALDDSRHVLKQNPTVVPEHWSLFQLVPDEVEFWEADSERRHTRLLYRADRGRWRRDRLWP